jgi:hypothetical protein
MQQKSRENVDPKIFRKQYLFETVRESFLFIHDPSKVVSMSQSVEKSQNPINPLQLHKIDHPCNPTSTAEHRTELSTNRSCIHRTHQYFPSSW